jgi:hypothetical protein
VLIRELLIYDWFRCGQKNLPASLLRDAKEKRSLRDKLYQQLPSEIEDLFSQKNRNRFFKQTIFYTFSVEAMHELGFVAGKSASLAFLLQRENSLMRLQHVALLRIKKGLC